MKKTFLLMIVAVVLTGSLSAQQYEFTTVTDNPSTTLKNQGRTGTCWCFATLSFLESELIRMGQPVMDLSEMYVVRNTYKTRFFDNYLRRGNGNLGPGSLSHTATNTIARYGIMPEEAYPGIAYDSPGHNHSELQGYLNALAEIPVKAKIISPESRELLDALLDVYLGQVPETFVYDGQEYTPVTFPGTCGIEHG